MRWTVDQLLLQQEKALLPLYLIVGNTPFLVQEATDQLKKMAAKEAYEILPALEAKTLLDWQQFEMNTHALSLFSTKIFIRLDLGEHPPKQDNIKNFLLPYIQKNPENQCLIITLSKLDAATQNAAWVKALDKIGAIVQIWPIDTEQLPQWLNQRMRRHGLSADRADIQLIANAVDGNLVAAAQFIETLHLLYGSRALSSLDVTSALFDSSKFDHFQWISYAIAGKSEKLASSLYRLQTENSDAVLFVWTMARELRRLLALLAGIEAGTSLDHLFTQEKIWKKHYPAYKACLKRVKKAALEQLLANMHGLDLIMKGAAKGDIWDELLRLGLQLAGKRNE